MKEEAIDLMIVDDHDLVRAGLRELIKGQDDIVLVGEAENGREVLERSRQVHPDVLLVDVKLGDMSGIDVVRQLKQDKGTMDIECLMLTVYDDMDVATEAIRAGATGYILKDCSKEELLDAVRKASRGELHLAPEISRKVLEVLKLDGSERLNTFLTSKGKHGLALGKGEDLLSTPGAGCAPPHGAGLQVPRHRRRTLHHPPHRQNPRLQHLPQAWGGRPRRRHPRGCQARLDLGP